MAYTNSRFNFYTFFLLFSIYCGICNSFSSENAKDLKLSISNSNQGLPELNLQSSKLPIKGDKINVSESDVIIEASGEDSASSTYEIKEKIITRKNSSLNFYNNLTNDSLSENNKKNKIEIDEIIIDKGVDTAPEKPTITSHLSDENKKILLDKIEESNLRVYNYLICTSTCYRILSWPLMGTGIVFGISGSMLVATEVTKLLTTLGVNQTTQSIIGATGLGLQILGVAFYKLGGKAQTTTYDRHNTLASALGFAIENAPDSEKENKTKPEQLSKELESPKVESKKKLNDDDSEKSFGKISHVDSDDEITINMS